MLNVEYGIGSKTFKSEDYLGNIESTLTAFYPDATGTLKLYIAPVDRKEKDGEHFLSATLIFPHPSEKDKDTHIRRKGAFDNMFDTFKQVIKAQIKQLSCEHAYITMTDGFGTPYRDGTGRCKHCELETRNVIPADNAKPFYLINTTFNGAYVAQFDWPENIRVSAGGTSIPSGKAFFEAYPTVRGIGTFIRGASTTIPEAEKIAFEKYSRYLSCKSHDWERTVNGMHRTDGCATCKHCGMFSSKALPPETLCMVCNAPTKRTWLDGHICTRHYFDLPIQTRLNQELSEGWKDDVDGMARGRDAEFDWVHEEKQFLLESRLHEHFYEKLGEDKYDIHHNYIQSIGFRFTTNIRMHLFKLGVWDNFNEYHDTSMNNPGIQAFFAYLSEQSPAIIEHMSGTSKEDGVDWSLVPGKYKGADV